MQIFTTVKHERRVPVRIRAARVEAGFTLVEIAIVLVLIGILLGSILRGGELITGSRVRSLATSSSDIIAAYRGFSDRYGRVPGDWSRVDASNAIGVTLTGGGNDNGRLDNPPGAGAYDESNAMWEQLAAAGFIQGDYPGTPGQEPDTENGLAPLNVYNGVIAVGRTNDFEGSNPTQSHVVFGRRVPVATMRELDTKLDDTRPETGSVRATRENPTAFAGTNEWGGRDKGCVVLTAGLKKSRKHEGNKWDIVKDAQDCNAVFLF